MQDHIQLLNHLVNYMDSLPLLLVAQFVPCKPESEMSRVQR